MKLRTLIIAGWIGLCLVVVIIPQHTAKAQYFPGGGNGGTNSGSGFPLTSDGNLGGHSLTNGSFVGNGGGLTNIQGSNIVGNITSDTLAVRQLIVTNAIGVASGGTGQASLTSGAILVGNGTGSVVLATPKASDFTISNDVLLLNRINVQTNSVDNTPTPVWMNTFGTNSILTANIHIVGKGHTNAIIGTWNIQVERDAAGPFLVASNWTGLTNSTYPMTNVYLTISGNNAVLNFIGTNGEDMNWSFIGDFNYMNKGINPPVVACNLYINNSGVGASDALSAVPNAVGPIQQAFTSDGNPICDVTVVYNSNANDHNYTIEVWDGTGGTGTQYGLASISNTPSTSGFGASATYIWTAQANEPQPPIGGYYYILVRTDAPTSTYSILAGPAASGGQGASYPAFIGSTPQTKSLNITVNTRH